jgi:uncharacterized protein
MILIDVNVLVYAFREDAPNHDAFRHWLEEQLDGDSVFGVSELALSGFLRIVTHPRIFDPPTPLETAVEYADTLRSQPNCIVVSPGPRHWAVFIRLCRMAGARGNLIPDAYFAALAIESGNEFVTTDRDYSRFQGLRWRPPF